VSQSVSLFAYGSLIVPEVVDALLDRVPDQVPATLLGWSARRLRHRPYPGLVDAPGVVTHGALFLGLRPDEVELLDDWEGDLYDVRAVTVRDATGRAHDARVYVLHDLSLLASGRVDDIWSRADLDAVLEPYCAATRDFRAARVADKSPGQHQ
jgi:hypothetical protein